MRERDLDRMLDLVEDQYLTASQDAARRLEQNPPIHWKRWAALAACAAIVVAGAFRLLGNGSLSMGGTGSREEHVSGDVFDYYAGPVLPLTLAEPAEQVDAVRRMTWDFTGFAAPPMEETSSASLPADVQVTDETELTNHGGEDRTVTVLYPAAVSLLDLTRYPLPTLTVDGAAVRTQVFPGSRTDSVSEWADYEALLSGGGYLKEAVSPLPDTVQNLLVQQVSVYTVDYARVTAGESGNPSAGIRLHIDPDRTSLLAYGFGSLAQDEPGEMEIGFPISEDREDTPHCLIFLGEDPGIGPVQAYSKLGREPQEDLEVTADVTRQEMTLEEILEPLALAFYGQQEDLKQICSFQDFYTLFCRDLTASFPGPGRAMELTGWPGEDLENLLSRTGWMNRVWYTAAEVTIPAGGSVTVTAQMIRPASRDHGYGNSKVYGYDLAIDLDSNLTFTAANASLENTGGIRITGQNFGFDLENGITEVSLDLEQSRYYLEVCQKGGSDP